MSCPMCDWDGAVVQSTTYHHYKYTHIALVDGEVMEGRTCYKRIRERTTPMTLARRAIARLTGRGGDR